MRGSLVAKAEGVWELRAYAGTVAGKKSYRTRTFRGGKRAAERELRSFVSAIEVERAIAPPSGPTVRQAVEGWFAGHQTKLAPGGRDTARTILDAYVLPDLGDVELVRLRGRAKPGEKGAVCLTAFYEGLVTKAGKPLAPSSVARVRGVLSLGLDYAVEAGWLAFNPTVARAKKKGRRQPKKRTPDADVLGTLMDRVAEARPDLHAWLCLVNTGARPVEVHAVRWGDIDFDARVLELRGDGVVVDDNKAVLLTAEEDGESDKRRARRLALDDYTLRAVDAWLLAQPRELTAPGAFMFSRDGGHAFRSPTWARQALGTQATAARKAGLALPDKVTPYTFRHFLGTQAIAAGMSVADVADRMANSPTTVLKHYVSPVKDGDRRIAELMGDVWRRG